MLDPLLIFVGAVVVICLATAFGPRFNLAGPLILMALGLGVSLLPFVPALEIDPELILVVVLPPLLYSAAVQLPAIEFRRDFGPIAGLSVLLVVVSSIVLGLFFAWLIPGLGIALGIALGAILSPTDAVATSIAKRLGISTRVVTLLEGESLLNDATALVLLRTAIAAVAGGFAFGDTVFAFAQAVIVAVLVGAVVGWLNLRVRAWVAHSAANTALSFTIPFIAYLPSEHLGGSGLVAAVVAGIVTGQGAARWFTPDERISDRLNWRTVELLLEGAVFLVMGLELKEIVQRNLERDQGLWQGAWLAVAALAIVLLVRSAYVAMLIAQVLQVALPCLVTNRAIKGVVQQQELHHVFTCVEYLFAGDVFNHHAIHYVGTATCHQLRHGAWVGSRSCSYFYQAGAAFTATSFELAVKTHGRGRHFATNLPCSQQYRRSWCHVNGYVVDGYLEQLWSFFFYVFGHY